MSVRNCDLESYMTCFHEISVTQIIQNFYIHAYYAYSGTSTFLKRKQDYIFLPTHS